MIIKPTDIFHIHTYRCGHAENIPDEEYIKKAVSIGASGIWFTDHAPFPGDPFGGRMRYAELEEYLSTLQELQEKYKGIIEIHIGLEAEYFPYFDRLGYYKKLKMDPRISILLLGQHMAQTSNTPPAYSFSWSTERLEKEEYKVLGKAVVDGIQSGYFDGVAHPDRVFRRCGEWTPSMYKMAHEIINAANARNIFLEDNQESKKANRKHYEKFWSVINGNNNIVTGLDAHCLDDLEVVKPPRIKP